MGQKSRGADAPSLSIRNKKAWHLYTILEKIEVGVSLLGTEVKAIRAGSVNFADAYVRIEGEEAYLENLHIGEYPPANRFNHEPTRRRRLLLHKREITKLVGKLREKGLTMVPLALYARGRWIKMELGLGRGKREYDRRDDIQKREADREIRRAMKTRSR